MRTHLLCYAAAILIWCLHIYHYNFLNHLFVKCISFIRRILSSCQSYKRMRLTTDQYSTSKHYTGHNVTCIYKGCLTTSLPSWLPHLSSLPLYIVHCTLCSKQTSYKCFPSPGPGYGTKVLAKLTEFNGCLSASFALSESEVANLQSKYT